MKYINPEMKINMFECESVATEASAITPEYVKELENVENKKIVRLDELTKVTKFVY